VSAYEPLNWAMKVPTLLRGDGRPDTVAHHVLVIMAAHADPDGTNIYPSVATLTKRAHLTTQKSVTDAIQRLEDAKLIVRTGLLQGGTVVWKLNYDIKGFETDLFEERAAQRRAAAATRQANRRKKLRELAETASHAEPERDVTACQSVTAEPESRGASANVTGWQAVSHGVPERESRGDARDNRRSPRLHQPLDQPLTGQVDLFPPTAGAAAPPINAGAIVAGWIEAFTEATGRQPNGGMRGQVGTEARRLLNDGEDHALVLEAAKAVGAKGFATLEREFLPMKARRTTGNGHTAGNQPYRNPTDPTAYEKGI
jgi:hypothetical protein